MKTRAWGNGVHQLVSYSLVIDHQNSVTLVASQAG